MTKFLNISVDNTLGGNSPSDETVSSQKAIKTYIDNHAGMFPSQTGNAGKFLSTNGTTPSWATVDYSTVGALPNTTTADDIGGANKDLSNLTSTGKNIGNWSSNITNCITYIPQDIKLELSSGTLTLKSGSKVYVPNGSGVFNTVTTSSDISDNQTLWGTGQYFAIFRYGTSVQFIRTDTITSGTTAPTPSNGKWWYDTTNNKIKSGNGTSWVDTDVSLPLALVTSTNGTDVASIDQIFNGFGYVSSTVFALPGVKCLIPNGRNYDGTLKNTTQNISSVITTTFANTENQTDVDCILQGTDFWARNQTVVKSASEIGTATGNYYIVNENRFVFSLAGALSSQIRVIIGKITVSSGVISNFNTKTAFRAFDYNDFNNLTSSYLSSICQGKYKEKTILFQGPISSGNITLSSSYTNFDALLVVGSGDNTSFNCETNFITKEELDIRRADAATYTPTWGSWVLFSGGNGLYWECNSDSTDTSFLHYYDNCQIQRIYGIKF